MLTAVADSLTATGRLPSAAIVDPLGEFVYVANQSDGTFSAFSISSGNGTLTAEPNSPFPCGASPKALALDPTGNNLYVANSAANTLTGINGLPAERQRPAGHHQRLALRARESRPHSIAVDAVAGTVYVADQGANTISGFKIGGAAGTLTAIAGSPFAAGNRSLPRWWSIPRVLFAYAANSNSQHCVRVHDRSEIRRTDGAERLAVRHGIDSRRNGDQRLTAAAEQCRQAATACTLHRKALRRRKIACREPAIARTLYYKVCSPRDLQPGRRGPSIARRLLCCALLLLSAAPDARARRRRLPGHRSRA